MVMAADEIAAIVQRGRAAFDDHIALRRALERRLEIFGEAASRSRPNFMTPIRRFPGAT
jgi:hypothetical protein